MRQPSEKPEKECFSIGETAKICGVSVQTLRFYSKIDLIQPAYINEETGYRYYLSKQFQLIDRAKYLQKFGFSLQEIEKIFQMGKTDYLRNRLEVQRKKLCEKQAVLREVIDEISWYCDYFQPMAPSAMPEIPYRQRYEERYIFWEMGTKQETTHEMYLRLMQRRNDPKYKDLRWRFHFCFLLDFNDFCNNIYTPLGTGVFLSEKPAQDLLHIQTLPAGEYLCMQAYLYKNDWNTTFIKELLKSRDKPEFVFASELEDHISDFRNSKFIVQFRIGD